MAISNIQAAVPENFPDVCRASEDTLARARQLMAQAIGIDGHIDTIQRVLVMGEDLGQKCC